MLFAPVGAVINFNFFNELMGISFENDRNCKPGPTIGSFNFVSIEKIVFGVRNIVQQNKQIAPADAIKQPQPGQIHRLMNADPHILYEFEADYFL